MIEYNAPDSKITLKITLSFFRWIEVLVFTIFIFFIFTFAMVSIVVHFSQQKVRFIDNKTEFRLDEAIENNKSKEEKALKDNIKKEEAFYKVETAIKSNNDIKGQIKILLKDNEQIRESNKKIKALVEKLAE